MKHLCLHHSCCVLCGCDIAWVALHHLYSFSSWGRSLRLWFGEGSLVLLFGGGRRLRIQVGEGSLILWFSGGSLRIHNGRRGASGSIGSAVWPLSLLLAPSSHISSILTTFCKVFTSSPWTCTRKMASLTSEAYTRCINYSLSKTCYRCI
jgi:hypothetical protein